MTDTTNLSPVSRLGEPAILVRIIGWGMLAVLAAYLINNILIVGYGFLGVRAVMSGSGGAGYLPLAIYAVAVIFTFIYVLRTPDNALRWDAYRIHNFNVYLIRACFWSVLLVGIVDAGIAFMRVEGLLQNFFDEDTIRALGRSRFVGPYIHVPLIIVGFVIALFTRTLGFTWLALMIVGAELLIVISRFVFSYEQALMGDLVRYWYAALFLFASAYTLFEEGHVRVDVLYAGFGNTTKGFVNAIGSLALGTTTCWTIILIGFGGKQAIINSPIMNFEVTQSGSNGMYVKYQMAAFLAIFAITMMIQFVSYFFQAVADRRNEPGQREVAAVVH